MNAVGIYCVDAMVKSCFKDFMSRLLEIKDAWGFTATRPRPARDGLDDVAWLIGEIERLERERNDAVSVCKMLIENWQNMTSLNEVIEAAQTIAIKE